MINPEIKEEYDNLSKFILQKYNIDLNLDERKSYYVQTNLKLVKALKIWGEKIESESNLFIKAKCYFDEIVSNVIYSSILAILDLKTPALIMIRRSLENILTFLYYIEHPVEYYKKELDGSSKNFNGFKELKDYIVSYPFICKNKNVDKQKLSIFCKEVLAKWTQQYKELSNYVHGTNSCYLDNKKYFDEIRNTDIEIIIKNTEELGSIINTLLILFFFNIYTNFEDESEKSKIRNCIKNEFEFKERLVMIFNEI